MPTSLPGVLALEVLEDIGEPCAILDAGSGEVVWRNGAWISFETSLNALNAEQVGSPTSGKRQMVTLLDDVGDVPMRKVVRWTAAGVEAVETPVVLRPYEANGRRLVTVLVSNPQPVIELTRRLDASEQLDPLTRLPGRAAIEARVTRLSQSPGTASDFALLFLDLDGFKSINDQCGHVTGDRVLADVASRLAGAIRAGDLIVRYGGDEFVVLVHGIRRREDLGPMIDRLRLAAETPFQVGDAQLSISASIGAALSNEDWQTVDDLIAKADRRMYAEKHQTQNTATE